MATLDNDDKKLLVESFKEALSATGYSGGGKAGSPYDSKPTKDSSSGATIDVTKNLGALGAGLGMAGQAVSGVTNQLKDNVEGFQQLSRTGASFNNNAMGMRDSIGQTRLSMEEYKDVMSKLSPSIAGLGGSVDAGTKNFNKFSGEFMKTDFAEQLTKMGYTTKDLNDVMAANMANRRFTDLSDETARKKAIEATAQLAREMDETAKLTGISRQEQMADMKQRTENGKIQAAIQLEVMKGGKDVEQQYNNMQQGLNGLGKGVKDLADEMFTGGVRTKEGAAKMAALGPAGVELQKAVTASKNAKSQEEKDAAALQLERAKAAVNERMKSQEFLQAVMTAGGDVGPAMQKMYEENKLRAGTTATETKTGATTGQAMAQNKQAAINQQQGRDETGAKDAGAKTTELYIQSLNRTKDMAGMAATGMNVLNNALVRNAETSNAINKGLDLTKSRRTNTQTGKEESFSDSGLTGAVDRLKELAGGTGATKGKPALGAEGTPLEDNRRNRIPRKPQDIAIEGLGSAVNKALGVSFLANDPGYVKLIGGINAKPEAEGSKDVWGDWFGGPPGIANIREAGPEAVVPKGKIGDFFKDMAAEGSLAIPNFASSMPDPEAMQKDMMASMPTKLPFDIPKMPSQSAETSKDMPKIPGLEGLMNAFSGITSKISAAMAPPPTSGVDIKAKSADMSRDVSKKLESKPAVAEVPKEDKKKEEKPKSVQSSDATLSDVVKSLDMLNKQMGELLSHSSTMADNSGAAVKATKGLNGNLFAR